MGGDHREDGHGERDIGRGGDGPAAQRPVAGVEIDQDEDQRGHGHAADGRRDGQRGARGIAQVACDDAQFDPFTDAPADPANCPKGSIVGDGFRTWAQILGVIVFAATIALLYDRVRKIATASGTSSTTAGTPKD